MALKAVLETLEELSEAEQAHYVEKDGKFYLDVTTVDGFELSQTSGLRSTLQKNKSEIKELKESLTKFEGIEPEKAKVALEKWQEIDNWTPDEKTKEAQEEFEKRLTAKLEGEKQQAFAKFEAEKKELAERRDHLDKELRKTLIDMAATAAIADAGGVPELLLHPVTSQMQIEEIDGTFASRVVDESGTVRMSTSPGVHDPMSVKELVAEMKENKVLARAFDGTGATGSGSKPSAPTSPKGAHTITAEEAKDLDLYRAKKAAAEKAGVELQPID